MNTVTFTWAGDRCTSLDAFFEEVSQVMLPGQEWDRTLEGFYDLLQGMSEEGCVIVWEQSDLARQALGYSATIAFYEVLLAQLGQGLGEEGVMQRDYGYLKELHPEWDEAALQEQLGYHRQNYRALVKSLQAAQAHQGRTLFDWLLSYIRDFPSIELRLQ